MTNRNNFLSKPKLWMSRGRSNAILSYNVRKFKVLNNYMSIVRPYIFTKKQFFRHTKVLKHLTIMLKNSSGRSLQDGHITVRHRGGGHSKRYRLVDMFRSLLDIPAIVLREERDPNRNCFLCLVCYANGVLSYIIKPENLVAGQLVISSGNWLPTELGNAFPLLYIPIGTLVHNIQIIPSNKFSVVRSAGTSAQVLKKSVSHTLIKLPSTELRFFNSLCYATIGVVSNGLIKFNKLKKAGNSRWLGIRPSVRGVAMNPIDHPHGGGQGKTSGGRPSVSAWARLTKGYKTVRSNKNKLIFKSRI